MHEQGNGNGRPPTPAASTDGGGMVVTVKDNAAIAAQWGRSGRVDVITVTGEIAATCPRCGGPRGKIRGYNGFEDGVPYHVNVWTNPCGHVDMYEAVVAEIRARRGAGAVA